MSESRWNDEHVTPLDFKIPNPWDGVDIMALKRERLLIAAREASIRDELEYALEENKLLREQVQHLLAENEEKRAQLRNFSQRLVQCKWRLAQLTLKR